MTAAAEIIINSKSPFLKYTFLTQLTPRYFSSVFCVFSKVSSPTSKSEITALQAPFECLRHSKFSACAFIWLFKSDFRKPSFGRGRSCLVTIMGLNGSWPHRRAFACWQPLPAMGGSEVIDFSGKVHFSSTLKQVEARTALFTQTAKGKLEKMERFNQRLDSRRHLLWLVLLMFMLHCGWCKIH